MSKTKNKNVKRHWYLGVFIFFMCVCSVFAYQQKFWMIVAEAESPTIVQW